MNTRERFVTLDAMRGIAALTVVFTHAQTRFGGPNQQFGALAVDFFFVLSGFVLAYAYDRRFESGLTAARFMRLRAERLYPLFWLGLATGAAVAVFTRNGIHNTPGLANVAMLPAGPHLLLFPGDDPAWSLFFEFWIANLGWALFWRQLRGRLLTGLIAISGALMVLIAFRYHTYDVGWKFSQILLGVDRVTFSFFLGVWLARLHQAHPPRVALAPWTSLPVLVAIMAVTLPRVVEPFYLVAAVFLCIPALVFYSAKATRTSQPLLTALGDASYATYANHWGLLLLFSYLTAHRQYHSVGSIIFALAAGTVGFLLDRYFDRPVRTLIAKGWPRVTPVNAHGA